MPGRPRCTAGWRRRSSRGSFRRRPKAADRRVPLLGRDNSGVRRCWRGPCRLDVEHAHDCVVPFLGRDVQRGGAVVYREVLVGAGRAVCRPRGPSGLRCAAGAPSFIEVLVAPASSSARTTASCPNWAATAGWRRCSPRGPCRRRRRAAPPPPRIRQAAMHSGVAVVHARFLPARLGQWRTTARAPAGPRYTAGWRRCCCEVLVARRRAVRRPRVPIWAAMCSGRRRRSSRGLVGPTSSSVRTLAIRGRQVEGGAVVRRESLSAPASSSARRPRRAPSAAMQRGGAVVRRELVAVVEQRTRRRRAVLAAMISGVAPSFAARSLSAPASSSVHDYVVPVAKPRGRWCAPPFIARSLSAGVLSR